MGVLADGEYTLHEFGEKSKIIGEYDACQEYIEKHGGTLCTQIDCEEYTDEGGEKESRCYVKGHRWVNRTGVYGVI